MATYGMFTEAINKDLTQQLRAILLNTKDEVQRNGEIEAAGLKGLRVIEKKLCFGNHDASQAEIFSVIVIYDKKLGKELANQITYAGQLLKYGNPNNKELFPSKQ